MVCFSIKILKSTFIQMPFSLKISINSVQYTLMFHVKHLLLNCFSHWFHFLFIIILLLTKRATGNLNYYIVIVQPTPFAKIAAKQQKTYKCNFANGMSRTVTFCILIFSVMYLISYQPRYPMFLIISTMLGTSFYILFN